MSLLTVVRHGQASFLSDDYDRLSAAGEKQAALLADYWLAQGMEFDAVYYGPAERHTRTGEIVAGRFRSAGRAWPKPVVLPELDEFPAEAIVRTFLPGLLPHEPQLRSWKEELSNGVDTQARQRAFDGILREVALRWARGQLHSPGIPTWQDFCHCVEATVRRMTGEAPKSSRLLVFTSSGPKAATARVAMQLSYEATLELTWMPRNCSVSEFLFTTGRFSLSTFNTTPHLTDPALLTYR
jgi:broad specificity phosphatase PhoE